MPIRLRKARPGDVDALLAIERASFASDRLSPRQLAAHAAGRTRARFVVAERAGEILGNALVFLRRGVRRARLYSIVVAARARGLGLGARLLARAEQEARMAGAGELSLEVRTGNRDAIALYERSGYRRTGVRPAYYEDGAAAYRYLKLLGKKGTRPIHSK
jgi:[ribosomal protein S18]-alanine N-acetyltransferase